MELRSQTEFGSEEKPPPSRLHSGCFAPSAAGDSGGYRALLRAKTDHMAATPLFNTL
jgi:hypothetical protein